VIDTYVYRVGIQMTKYSYATAIGLAQSVISVVLVVFGFRLAKRFNGYSIV
jgi:putative aldouronate transport system permease protein